MVLTLKAVFQWTNVYHLPMKGKADGNMRNRPLLYMVNVTAKYMARLPRTKNVLTAVQ